MVDSQHFGFKNIHATLEEYQSSIDVHTLNDQIPLMEIAPDVAENLTYRMQRLIEEKGWKINDVSVVYTLTIAKGSQQHRQMSLHQQKD